MKEKQEILHLLYTSKIKTYNGKITDSKKIYIHGIFTDKEISKYRIKYHNVFAIPLNKFIKTGAEL